MELPSLTNGLEPIEHGTVCHDNVQEDGTHRDCIFVYRDGKIVGYLMHHPEELGPEVHGRVVAAVEPEYQRQGIGRILWAEAVARFGVKQEDQILSPDAQAFFDNGGGDPA